MKFNRVLWLICLFSLNVHSVEISFSCMKLIGRSNQDKGGHALLNNNSYLFGIFDGHGNKGEVVAQYACKYFPETLNHHLAQFGSIPAALKYAFEHVNDECNLPTSGSTATTAIIHDDVLYIANVGDSKGVICIDGQAIQITQDHKPDKWPESERLQKLGATVVDGRINGGLSMSRAIWDKCYWPYVISTPYINTIELKDTCEFAILASDGVWDFVNIETAVHEVRKSLKNSNFDLDAAATHLAQFSWRKYRENVEEKKHIDDITVIIIGFNIENQRKKLKLSLEIEAKREEEAKKRAENSCCTIQ